MIIFWNLFIGIIFVLIIISLGWTMLNFETSPLYFYSKLPDTYSIFELSQKEMDTWAIRGQIGDILAGHFSVLAFIAIAFSIYLQSEGNKQIQKSIEQQEDLISQQKDALEIQSKALKVQTEEFISNNLNMRLEKYYQILDKHLEIVTENLLYSYIEDIETLNINDNFNPKYSDMRKKVNKEATKIRPLVMTLNYIYGEIIKIEKTSPSGYQTYIGELRLRLYSNEIFHTIHTSINEYKETPVFNLYKKETP